MKKILVFLFTLAVVNFASAQDIFVAGNPSSIKFYSDSPIKDVKAESNSITGALNRKTKDVYFKVAMTSFVFDNPKMQEHFNENYMESELYPNAEFKGVITSVVDLSKDGQYTVSVKGSLTIHGVTIERMIDGTVTVKDGKVYLYSKFQVKCADHNIKIPSAVTQNIAESIDVSVNFTMIPYTK